MTIDAADAIQDPLPILREYNAWRRGGDGPMPDPAVIGRAIDAMCDDMERLRAQYGLEWRAASVRPANAD